MVGKEVDGYRIEGLLGRGGMGIVYKAENQALGRTVALKVIAPDLAEDEAFLKRFRREARTLAQLYHPHIVLVFSLRQSDLGLCIAMEYVAGKTLADHLKASGPMAWPHALPLIKQLLSALAYAHERGVIHRDLKPSNIMVTEDGTVKVMDFGLAKMLTHGSGETTVTSDRAGTLCYMSPEQARGLKNVDPRSDLFSLGLTLYEVLAGRLPFEKDDSDFTILKAIVEEKTPDPRTYNPALPRRLSKILMKALEKHPARRYQRAGEMLAAFEAFERQEREPYEATVLLARPRPDVSKPRRRRLRPTALAVVLGALSLAGYLFLPGFIRSLPPPARSAEAQEAVVPPLVAQHGDEQRAERAAESPDDARPDAAVLPAVQAPAIQPVEGAETKPVAATGSLTVRSVPPGARLFLDDTPRGTTPQTLAAIPTGRYTIALRLDGYEPYAVPVTIAAQRQRTLEATLVPRTGVLQVSVHPSGRLSIDGAAARDRVSGSASFDVPVGRHTVTVDHPEFGRWRQEVIIATDAPEEVAVDFTRFVGLTVVAVDTEGRPVRGEIFVDGEARGMSPRALQVRVGLRRIEVRADGYVIDGAAPVLHVARDRSEPLQVALRKEE